MENAKEWCRLINDCLSGKVDLIVTQKLGNVSSDPDEIAFLARILASQKHPVGIYVILSRMGSALNKKMTNKVMDAFDSISDHINRKKHDENNKNR